MILGTNTEVVVWLLHDNSIEEPLLNGKGLICVINEIEKDGVRVTTSSNNWFILDVDILAISLRSEELPDAFYKTVYYTKVAGKWVRT